mmetsp:Transcript_5568/g.13568  ORF Transcript_5568/g.13568 Transcript_5568/m.13568 type:complete len:81 (-) Transcript_5568:47-289(-)
MVTGLVTTTATAPVDLVKSRMFVGSAKGGMVHAAYEVFCTEGMAGFFRGWSAQYLRLGPQTMVTFVVMERVRQWAGMDAF